MIIHDAGIEAINVIDSYRSRIKDGYEETFSTFDIETTSLDKEAFMYMFGWCIGEDVIIGRTWEEFLEIVEHIKYHFRGKHVVYCHNLPFEFQFIRNFMEWDKTFSVAKRKIVKAVSDNLEFRCSYKLSNMSLKRFCENEGAFYQKQSGEEFDYREIRYPWTGLEDKHYVYQYCDVRGLHQCIEKLLESDTLRSIPMTSTGYVRRECREAVLSNPINRKMIKEGEISEYIYALLRAARRGGDTHVSPIYTGEILENVDSYDKASSYPYEMMTKEFPMGQFVRVSKYERSEKHAFLMRISFTNIRVKSLKHEAYISIAKCIKRSKFINDNGRILKAEYIEIAMTDLDYEIILDCYDFDELDFIEVYCARTAMLPKELREVIMDYFDKKTNLKGVDDYFYTKSKNKLNSIFGMMLTDICMDVIQYIDDEWKEGTTPISELLYKYFSSEKSFLLYQWGVWVTAWARYDLYELKRELRDFTTYSDTDSWKLLKGYDKEVIEKINQRIREEAERFDIKPYVLRGDKKVYLGVWEYEETIEKFKTLGAKKYAIENNGRCKVTVSGLSKEKGSEYITRIGGIEKFKEGLLFSEADSGRTYSIYNDVHVPYYLDIGGRKILTASSVAIHDTTYVLGLTGEYEDLIKLIHKGIDIECIE